MSNTIPFESVAFELTRRSTKPPTRELKVWSNNDGPNTISPAPMLVHRPQSMLPVRAPRYPRSVLQCLSAAVGTDLTQDQPYMPEPFTTLREALGHLRFIGYILVQGGRIDYIMGQFFLSPMGGRKEEIDAVAVRRLLKANYPSPVNKRTPSGAQYQTVSDMVSSEDIILCCPNSGIEDVEAMAAMPTSPTMKDESCLVVIRAPNTDIDTIYADEWRLSYFAPTGTEKYVGKITLNGADWYCWWSDQQACFVAQTVLDPELVL